MAATIDGLHAPNREDDVEPALADEHPDAELTDPSDVAILVKQLVERHARIEFAAGAAIATDGFLDIGAVSEESVTGFYNYSVPDVVAVAEPGRYRITARVEKGGSDGAYLAEIRNATATVLDSEKGGAEPATFTLTGELRVATADGFAVVGATIGSDTLRVLDMSIVRVAP